MYACLGIPKVVSPFFAAAAASSESESRRAEEEDSSPSRPPSLLLGSAGAANNSLLWASFSADTLHLWTARPRAMVAMVPRTPESLAKDGDNRDVVWQPDGSTLALITTLGSVHFFAIVGDDSGVSSSSSLRYDFLKPHPYMTGAGEGKGVVLYQPQFVTALRISAVIISVLALRDELMVFAGDGHMHLLNWKGAVVRSINLSSIPLMDGDSPSDAASHTLNSNNIFVHVIQLKSRNTFVASDIEGLLYLLKRNSENKWTAQRIFEHHNHHPPATAEGGGAADAVVRVNGARRDRDRDIPCCLAFNPKFSILTVGYTNGLVKLFEFPVSNMLDCRLVQTLSPQSIRSVSSLDFGAVIQLAWTTDGCALAVGWKQHSLAVWSIFGKLLMSTAPRDDSIVSGETSSEKVEIFHLVVKNLFWGSGNMELIVCPALDNAEEHTKNNNLYVGSLCVFPFVHSASAALPTQDNCRTACIIGDSELLLHVGDAHNEDLMTPNILHWRNVSVPLMYLNDNWPIRYASVSADGRCIAIAGKRGLATYNVTNGRWKLFGNMQHERDFMCQGGLAWAGDVLIAACQDMSKNHFELRFYSRNLNLDNSLVLHTERISHRILFLDVLDDFLLVYTMDNSVHEFRMTVLPTTPSGKIPFKLSKLRQSSLADVVPNPSAVQSVYWYSYGSEGVLSAPLLILAGGVLSMYFRSANMNNLSVDAGPRATEKHLILHRNVHAFWLTPSTVSIPSISNSIWALSASGITAFLINDVSTEEHTNDDDVIISLNSSASSLLSLEFERIQFEIDFFPLSILIQNGLVIGISQELSYRRVFDNSVYMFKLSSDSQLYLHHVFRHLISKRRLRTVTHLGNLFKDLSYFGHSLEILLHEVLESEWQQSHSDNTTNLLFPMVVQFVEQFPHFLDVVVKCARKTEVDSWSFFFFHVGHPKDLFDNCLETGRLKTASNYLLILQNMESETISKKCASKLVDTALNSEDFETTRELLRFLSTIGTLSLSPPRYSNDSDSGDFYLSILLSRHARLLLQDQRIRTLGKFAKMLDFPIVDWLSKEKSRTALIPDYLTTTRSIHNQFCWPYPSSIPGEIEDTVFADITRETQWFYESSASPKDRYRKRTAPKVQELRWLLQVTHDAEYFDWHLLIATMLLSALHVSTLLHRKDAESRNRAVRFEQLIAGLDCPGYTQFYAYVQQNKQ